jgi:lipid A 3-O-deacylase
MDSEQSFRGRGEGRGESHGSKSRCRPRLAGQLRQRHRLATGENTAPSRTLLYTRRAPIHGFLALDARYVLHDITLDGNTWRDSPSVERKDFVADVGVGFAVHWNGWRMTFARYFRTKEFEGQKWDTKLGSIAIQRDI